MMTFCVLIISLIAICHSRVLPPETSIFSTTTYPEDRRLMPTIGNGYVALQATSHQMYVGGVFNGPVALNDTNNSVSHRARIPSTNSLGFGLPVPYTSSFILDVNNAYYQEQFTFPNSSTYMNHTNYAHQYYRNLLISTIDIDNKGDKPFSFDYYNQHGNPSNDINFTSINCPSSSFTNLSCTIGWTQIAEYTSPLINVVLIHFADLEGTINVPANSKQKVYFPTIILTSLETSTTTILNDAVKLFETLYNDKDKWLSMHINSWETIWNDGRIDIIGNDSVASSVYSSLYYIMNSIRSDWPYGLSPGSLSSNAYNGHTFWDQESWMYSPLLMVQQNLGKSCLDYRSNRLYGAYINANTSKQSDIVSGSVRYPWESGFIGMELCPPNGNPEGAYEIHINADIPLALQQYFYMTQNVSWLSDIYEMLSGICTFWVDWSYYNTDTHLYEFLNVQGPDEYYVPVNNSAYTNYGAKQSLSFCIESAKLLNKQYPSKWQDIVDNTYIPFDNTNKYHPESDNYKNGQKVKQADTILLYYPWNMALNDNVSIEIQTNDLNYYESVTDPSGPAMTWAMFVINWLSLNEPSKAQIYFDRSYANIQKPFNVWTETSNGGGSVTFITGAGGFLQQFIFGYPKIRVNNKSLSVNFNSLPWNQMALIGIDYLQNTLDFMFYQKDLSFDVTVRRNDGKIALMLVDKDGNSKPLSINTTVHVLSAMVPVRIVQSS